MKRKLSYFTPGEWALWGISAAAIVLSFVLFRSDSWLTLCASLVGITSLLFNAKGNPIGQALMLVFGVLYAIISWTFRYYGEMMTYLGMTAPMALAALISWLRHPYGSGRAEVAVNRLPRREMPWMLLLTAAVTAGFYFLLAALHTANLIPSTVSVTTSFLAAYLTFRRSAWFAAAYAANDVVLIVLWSLASLSDPSYLSVVVCFAAFLAGDLYGFFSWRRMRKRQSVLRREA